MKKTKWTFTNSNHDEYIDIDADYRICSIPISEEILREQEITKEEAFANAKLICDAVNAYMKDRE